MKSSPPARITGGSTGIGLTFAKLLAEDGHDLIITGASARVLDAAETLRTHGAEVTPVQSGLSTRESVRDVGDAARKAGHLDVMVLNVGIVAGGNAATQRSRARTRKETTMHNVAANGAGIPALGFGTFRMDDAEVAAVRPEALTLGLSPCRYRSGPRQRSHRRGREKSHRRGPRR